MRNFRARLLAFTFAWLCILPLSAQQDYTLMLKAGHEVLPQNVDVFISNPNILPGDVFEGRIYRLLQFQEIPDQPALDRIAASGIRLLQYIPNFTYIASLPAQFDFNQLPMLRVRHVSALAPHAKFDKSLRGSELPSWAVNGEYVEINVMYHSDIDPASVESFFNAAQVQVLYASPNYKYITLNAETATLNDLAALPFVTYLEAIAAPPVPDDRRGQSLHRSNTINTLLPSSRKFDGTGVSVLVRDDGLVGPHIDYQGRMTNLTSDATGNHGDGVAGIICGAGNLDPDMQGMAPGATLYVINYVASFLDNTLNLHFNSEVVITNSSYSNGCNAGYTSTAVTVDQQGWDNPTLMHVFSAGNSNNNNCGYGAGDQFGNVTGGHKIGKNVIATANVDAADVIDNSSSHGPSADGRLKPDITANGRNQNSTDSDNTYMSFGGTSAAAPSIAGVSAQLYHAYKTMNSEVNPPAALIKAIMMNTADEIGNKGPDYFYGWGRINALKALKTLEEGRYLTDTITQGATNTHTITVPANVRLMKVMTYWAERPAFAGASKALINDLNTAVIDPANQLNGTWLLSSARNATLLGAPATIGIDNRNNVEQVSIDDPAAGTYTLSVNGATVPNGALKYYVTYEFVMDEIMVTYPLGGEGFAPREVERIRWDAPVSSSPFFLEYSTNNGATWSVIGSAPASRRFLDWVVPSTLSGEALIRISNGTLMDVNDDPFSIIEKPTVSVLRICQAFTTIRWTTVPGATEYDIFALGNTYMDSIGTTTADTFAINGTVHTDVSWFAVRAKGPNGEISRRTVAIPSGPGLDNCNAIAAIPGFDAPERICAGEVADFFDQSQNYPQSWQWIVSPAGGFRYVNGTSNTSKDPRIQFLAPGTYNVLMVVSNEAGSVTLSKTIQVDPAPIPAFSHVITGPTVAFSNNSFFATRYLWDFGDGTTDTTANPTHTYSGPGSYQVKLVIYAACGADSIINTVEAWPTAIGDLLEELSLEIYPNPGDGLFTLNLDGAEPGIYEMEVLNLQGQSLKEFSLGVNGSTALHTLDLTGIARGIYFLKISREEQTGTVKLMVK